MRTFDVEGIDDVKALSVKQPYASLIAIGAKIREFRTWAPPAAVIGTRIAIVASKSPKWDDLPTGEAVCTVRITGYDAEAEAWLLAEPQPVKSEPIRGRLNVYSIDVALEPCAAPPVEVDDVTLERLADGRMRVTAVGETKEDARALLEAAYYEFCLEGLPEEFEPAERTANGWAIVEERA